MKNKIKICLLTIIMTCIAIFLLGESKVCEATWDGKYSTFVSSSAKSMLGVNSYASAGSDTAFSVLYNSKNSIGHLACFYHAAQGSMGTVVHSAYVVYFNETSGTLAIKSYIVGGSSSGKNVNAGTGTYRDLCC